MAAQYVRSAGWLRVAAAQKDGARRTRVLDDQLVQLIDAAPHTCPETVRNDGAHNPRCMRTAGARVKQARLLGFLALGFSALCETVGNGRQVLLVRNIGSRLDVLRVLFLHLLFLFLCVDDIAG